MNKKTGVLGLALSLLVATSAFAEAVKLAPVTKAPAAATAQPITLKSNEAEKVYQASVEAGAYSGEAIDKLEKIGVVIVYDPKAPNLPTLTALEARLDEVFKSKGMIAKYSPVPTSEAGVLSMSFYVKDKATIGPFSPQEARVKMDEALRIIKELKKKDAIKTIH